MKQPCERDCPDRKAGCGATCPKWAKYVEERNRGYIERQKQKDFENAVAFPKSHKKRRR